MSRAIEAERELCKAVFSVSWSLEIMCKAISYSNNINPGYFSHKTCFPQSPGMMEKQERDMKSPESSLEGQTWNSVRNKLNQVNIGSHDINR